MIKTWAFFSVFSPSDLLKRIPRGCVRSTSSDIKRFTQGCWMAFWGLLGLSSITMKYYEMDHETSNSLWDYHQSLWNGSWNLKFPTWNRETDASFVVFHVSGTNRSTAVGFFGDTAIARITKGGDTFHPQNDGRANGKTKCFPPS